MLLAHWVLAGKVYNLSLLIKNMKIYFKVRYRYSVFMSGSSYIIHLCSVSCLLLSFSSFIYCLPNYILIELFYEVIIGNFLKNWYIFFVKGPLLCLNGFFSLCKSAIIKMWQFNMKLYKVMTQVYRSYEGFVRVTSIPSATH